jgi:succinate-semialdehyde dehydrogenase/glutarate-semialdehyde dehydrogenase
MTAVDVTALMAKVPTQLLIGGAWQDATGGETFGVDDPATGKTLLDVADARPEDGAAALDAACTARTAWAETAPRERAELLRRAFDLVIDRRDEFATLMTLEMGKPLAEAQGELNYGADFLRWFSEEAVRIDGGFMRSPDGRGRLLVMRQPVGPCLLITPWNFPLAMATRKIAPALAAGCTMVLKPAAETPLTTLLFAALLQECGLPDGVLNVLPTTQAAEVTSPLLADGRIRKLSFTGSTPVGRRLLAQCSDQVLRTSMELGGNAPFLVFDDADLDAAVEGAVLAKMRNMGEACTAANRIYVQREVSSEFAARLAQRLSALRLGHGLDPETQVGPLIGAAAVDKVSRLVQDAVDKGASVVTGGRREERDGFFYAPTVLADVPADAELLDEEVFGPVAPIIPFDTEEEGIELANGTEYGLVGYVFTQDLSRALRVTDALEVGMVGLNQGVVSNAAAPFGGVKASGIGREGGAVGIDEYLNTKYVAVAP